MDDFFHGFAFWIKRDSKGPPIGLKKKLCLRRLYPLSLAFIYLIIEADMISFRIFERTEERVPKY